MTLVEELEKMRSKGQILEWNTQPNGKVVVVPKDTFDRIIHELHLSEQRRQDRDEYRKQTVRLAGLK